MKQRVLYYVVTIISDVKIERRGNLRLNEESFMKNKRETNWVLKDGWN